MKGKMYKVSALVVIDGKAKENLIPESCKGLQSAKDAARLMITSGAFGYAVLNCTTYMTLYSPKYINAVNISKLVDGVWVSMEESF